ncbi:MAG: hypothetical protein RDU25_05745 [Patescibacteria group bacterium]|nr:hypothetical protein [Patescibacteria group bacterium]
MFGMSGEMPKAGKKKAVDVVPEEINIGFASGIEDEEDEGPGEVVWAEAELSELRSLCQDMRTCEAPFEKKAYRISNAGFIKEKFPKLKKNEVPAYMQELAEVEESIASGIPPRTRHFTPEVMREFFLAAVKISRKNQR